MTLPKNLPLCLNTFLFIRVFGGLICSVIRLKKHDWVSPMKRLQVLFLTHFFLPVPGAGILSLFGEVSKRWDPFRFDAIQYAKRGVLCLLATHLVSSRKSVSCQPRLTISYFISLSQHRTQTGPTANSILMNLTQGIPFQTCSLRPLSCDERLKDVRSNVSRQGQVVIFRLHREMHRALSLLPRVEPDNSEKPEKRKKTKE